MPATSATPTPTPASQSAQVLARIAAQVRLIAKQHQRHDLAERLDTAHATLNRTNVDVVVVGQFKQGKSALVNALVDASVCPVDDVVATAIPTRVSWGEQVQATLVTQLPDEGDEIRTSLAPERLRHHVTEHSGRSGVLGNVHAEVLLPHRLLSDGLTIIDTPGVGRAHAQAATNLTLLPQADATVMVSDATQELTQPELAFLRQAQALCPRVSCVVSKTDLQRHWRSIVAENQNHLRSAGITVPLIPTSALLHSLAAQEKDATLATESNISALATHLRHRVREDVLISRQQQVRADLVSVTDHLTMVLRAELDTLRNPTGEVETILGLEEAESVAHRLTQRSARWQQTLGDGAAELLSDIEFDLRDRLREVGREAEQLIDSSDPGKVWEETGSWLAESVTQAVSDNFVWAHQRSIHLAEVVAEHFSLDGRAAVPTLSAEGVGEVLRSIGGLDLVSNGKLTIGQKLMIGLKGSYGGVLMFGLMTTLAGMALVNPLSIAAGLVMGGFAYRQDSAGRLEQRRNEAKGAVRKLIDESIFQVGKAARDRANRIRRVLRDHFTQVAEELKRSLTESVQRAKHSRALPTDARQARMRELEEHLAQIQRLAAAATTQRPHESGPLPQPAPTPVERRPQ